MPQRTLSENAMKIYVYMITKRRKVGPREIQKIMNFASPSSAVFHLQKLVESGLIEEDRGEYYVKEIKRIGILSNFFIFQSYIIPKDLIYLLIVGGFVIIDAMFFLQPVILINLLTLIPAFLSLTIFLLNTINEISMLLQLTDFEYNE